MVRKIVNMSINNLSISVFNINNGKNEQNLFEWPNKRGKNTKDYTGWEFRMWPLAVLTRRSR